MLYATDIPHNKQAEYVTFRLCLHFIKRPSCISLFATHINVCSYEIWFSSKGVLLKLLEKLYRKLQNQYIFTSKNVHNKCSNSSTCRIDCIQQNFLQCMIIIVKWIGQVPHPKSPSCQVWLPQVLPKCGYEVFSFHDTTWSRDLMGGVHLFSVTTLPSIGAIGDVKTQI